MGRHTLDASPQDMAPIYTALLAVFGIVCAVIVRRRHSIMNLRWPEKLDYFPFRRRLRSFIIRSGFKVTVSPEVPFDLEANINGKLVMFICVPDSTSVVGTKILDWAEVLSYKGMGRQLVCVTADPIHESLAREASSRSITVLHYKRLKDFLPAAA